MSNETKQDVFNDALRALEEFGEQGSSWEMAYDDLSARYADATGGETEAQRTCPYCHKPHRVIPTDDEFGFGGEPENFLRIGMTGGDVWNGIPPKLTPSGAIHTVMPVGYDNAEVDETISINYCPMCGRNLAEAEK